VTDLATLHDLLLVPGDLDLRAVAGLFTKTFDSDGSIVFLVDPTGHELEVGAADPPGGLDERRLRIPVGYGVSGLVALNGHAVTLVDDNPRNEAHRQLLGLEPGGMVSRMCFPAHGLSSTIVGVVSVHRRSSVPFTDADLARAERIADLVGLRLYAQGLLGAAEEHQSQRDRLIAQAVSAQEAERRRIAGDLHDGVTQALASLAFHLSAADVGLASAEVDDVAVVRAVDEIQQARQLAVRAYDETRAAIMGLHSLILDDLGLVAALESLAQTVPQLEVEFRGDTADQLGPVPDHCAAVLYRIAQEAVNNAVKHAQAQRAVVSIRRVGDALVLGITDDGVGFDVAQVREQAPTSIGEHFGLASIAERCALIGARLRIDSVEGRGTAVIVELPLT
jgi:two-component system, NarL family, sensor kinase